MKKLVTALIIVLPFVLLVALFAVTGIARISMEIPANGISISNRGEDGIFFFDLADYKYPLYENDLGVEVLPRVAHNREYDLKITDLNGKPTDTVTREENGAFALHKTGLTKLTYTSKDGGYSDSVLFNVTASAPLTFTPTISDEQGNNLTLNTATDTDYQITLTSGKYTLGATCYPSSVIFTPMRYDSLNENVLYFSDTCGHFVARFEGNTIITMTSDGVDGEIVRTIAVTVTASADTTLDGADITDNARVTAPIGTKTLSFGVQSKLNISAEEISVSGENIEEFRVVAVDGANGAFIVTLKFREAVTDIKSLRYTLALGEKNYSFYIDFKNRDFCVFLQTNADGKGDIILPVGSYTKLIVSSNPHSPNIRYSWHLDEQEATTIISSDGNECTVLANSAFDTALTVGWEEYGENGDTVASGIITRNIKSIYGYSALIFAENADSYGLGGLAIASDKYAENGSITPYMHESKFRAYGRNGKIADIHDMEFSVSDASLASVNFDDSQLYVNALGNGDVTVFAKWKYGELFGIEPASFTFRAVKGIAVDCDRSIRQAFESSLPVVLTQDIYLGENLFEKTKNGGRIPKYSPEIMHEKLLSYTKELPTTGDWQYYENLGLSHPTVRYCLDITADLHGNGHFISAQYITDMLDSTDTLYDFAVFGGPLDFVATSSYGIKLAAVKAQDNIVFLIRKDGIKIDNAVLKGCDDETLYDDGSINLSLLNNVGTTLEIMSDAQITRSRVMNGRTVVRIFGRDSIDRKSAVNASKEKINVVIDGCVLQCAREFILKIGTNRAVIGDVKNPAPSLLDAQGNEYDAYNSKKCDLYIDDDYFMSNYVLTDVTLKNSILRTSGMLSIGIESHFAGEMLVGDPKSLLIIDDWHNLAGTSYPAILHLEGDVTIDDWKDVRNVDSSSIVEADTSQKDMAFLALNVSEMLKAVQEFGGEQYSDIISNVNGQKLVHGGIAFYGGGKNYSILDMSKYTGKSLENYNINLNILTNSKDYIIASQGALLPLAAGIYDFRFVIENEYN